MEEHVRLSKVNDVLRSHGSSIAPTTLIWQRGSLDLALGGVGSRSEWARVGQRSSGTQRMVDGGKEPYQTLSPGGDGPLQQGQALSSPRPWRATRGSLPHRLQLVVSSQKPEAGPKGPPTFPAQPVLQVSPLPHCLPLPGEAPWNPTTGGSPGSRTWQEFRHWILVPDSFIHTVSVTLGKLLNLLSTESLLRKMNVNLPPTSGLEYMEESNSGPLTLNVFLENGAHSDKDILGQRKEIKNGS